MVLSKEQTFTLRFLKNIKATEQDAVAIALVLETEDNFAALNNWMSEQSKNPSFFKALVKALEIREKSSLPMDEASKAR